MRAAPCVVAMVVMSILGAAVGVGRAAVVAEGAAAPRAVPVDVFVNLTTDNLAFEPAQFAVPPNATVRVRITQGEAVPHTFTLGAEVNPVIPTTFTPAELDAYLDGNNLTDVPIPATVGTVVWANFTAPLAEGRYEFVCRVPGHFQVGMLGFMDVSQEEVFANVTTSGLRFEPDRIVAPPNALVHVRITQGEAAPHTFTLGTVRDEILPSTLTSQEVDDYFRGRNLTDAAIAGVVGTVVWANFTAPSEIGQYEFVCRVPGHFQAGMVGFLIVAETPPPPGGGLRVDVIQGIMLATIAFVLLFAAAYQVRAMRAQRRKK